MTDPRKEPHVKPFEYSCPTKIVCGESSLRKLPTELRDLEVTKPLLLTDANLLKLGVTAHAIEPLEEAGIPYALFDRIPPDSSLDVVNEVASIYREQGCDGIIALGGGSVIDTGKGAGASLSCEGADFASLQGSEILRGGIPPFVAIPTTAGTGSEVTLVAVVADTEAHAKLSYTSYHLVPDVAILDPVLTQSLPPKLTATTGMDALTHAIEAYTSIQKNPVSDAFATKAVQIIAKNLPTACAEGGNADARTNLALGSLMAGAAFSNAMVGIVHSIGHSLGGLCHIPHGQAMTMLLPHCASYNVSKGVHRGLYGELLPFLSPEKAAALPAGASDEERDKAFVECLFEMNRSFHDLYGVPLKLSELGVDHDDLEAVAVQARYDGSALYNASEITVETAMEILEAVY